MMFRNLSLLVLSLAGFCRGDTFTSIREMESLFDLEQYLVGALDIYLKHAAFQMEVMDLHYEELFKIESEIQDIEKYTENPVNAYSVVRRMHYDWPTTFKLLSTSPFFEEDPQFPDKSVVQEAIAQLVQWQTRNNLDTKNLARGFYQGIMPHANLTAFDCLEIAKYCYNTNNKKLSIQWLEEALIKVQESSGDPVQMLIEILEYTFLAKCLTGDLKGSVSAYTSLITDGAYWYTRSPELRREYKQEKVKNCQATAKEDLKAKKTKTTSLFSGYTWSSELCHSARRAPSEGECHIITDLTKLLLLKVETLSIEPRIGLIHNFLPNNIILSIKESALNQFETLNSRGLNGPVPLSSGDNAETLEYRLGNMLNISPKMIANDLLFFIHAPGGKHTSVHSFENLMAENKIGTLYYFINDVVKGGNVIFPQLKLSIEPAQGSLLMWFDGENKIEVEECPVLVGSKWSLTQSLLERW